MCVFYSFENIWTCFIFSKKIDLTVLSKASSYTSFPPCFSHPFSCACTTNLILQMIGEKTNETLRSRPGDTQAIGSHPSSHRRCPRSPRLCGLWAMKTRWTTTLVGGRALPPVLRASFSILRVKVCRSGAQVVVVVPRAIRSPRF
jgi:hypothetical protein